MAHRKESVETPRAPEDFLRLALEARSADQREAYAKEGLVPSSAELCAETHVLLLRQVYLAHLERAELLQAAEVAKQMAAVGPLADVAHHDAARALFGAGREREAIWQQRLAARRAPADRRSFHLWSLATWQHFAGEGGDALATLERAERWAQRDRALIRAHRAYIELDQGGAPEHLEEIVGALRKAKASAGYGQYLLGMIAWLLGDAKSATPHLRAFLRRHAGDTPAQALTLREELRRARMVLARIESD